MPGEKPTQGSLLHFAIDVESAALAYNKALQAGALSCVPPMTLVLGGPSHNRKKRISLSIPSILQNIWDSKLKGSNVVLILCGSAISFMEKEVLAEKNPLYGRATGILKMNAMDFYDAVQFFPGYSPLDKIASYAVLGGVLHYLKQFQDTVPLAENIEKNILTRGSILYSEVEFLMRQELWETTIYNTVIEAVALGNTKLNELYQKTQIDKAS